MPKSLVVIPTYNEAENVPTLIPSVLNQAPDIEVLIVDDSSPDGTAAVVRKMMESDSRIHILERKTKMGLGSAYVEGFKYAIRNSYDCVFEMDADFSHSPAEIPNFLKESEQFDLVLGSRYVNGVRVLNWPIRRLILSFAANVYTRIVTGMPLHDATGGFKCFRRKVLEAIDLDSIKSNGYAFQIEMSYKTWKNGFKVTEIPITFHDRRSGVSKMSRDIVYEAFFMVWKLRIEDLLNRF